MNRYDFAPLYRSTVGFDRLLNLIDTVNHADAAPSYPPYNIEQIDENDYRITMAIAGFTLDDLTVEVRDNTLTVTGRRDTGTTAERRFLHQGIAERGFERRFQLADHVVVRDASLENGLLSIDLVREVPERLKPRRIDIRGGDAAKPVPAIETEAA